WRMYQRPGAPAKEEILAARDRVLSRHPKLRMIGCHIGSNEQDLTRAARRLDAHPNFVMDLAARVRILMRQDPKTVREFVLKYADRLLYGTAFQPGANDENAAKSFVATHEAEWNYFADTLALPEKELRQIFRENAIRWLPGFAW